MQNTSQTVADKFLKHLKDNNISIEQVASMLERSRQHVDKVLKNRRLLTATMRTKLNVYLNTNF